MLAKNIDEATWGQGLSWETYRDTIQHLAETQGTTGDIDPEQGVRFTHLNAQRMSRWSKTARLGEEMQSALRSVQEPQRWLVLSESWCGDAAQSVPFLALMAAESPWIDLRFLWRDQHLDIMDAYLTDGRSRSIPKLIAFTPEREELFTWGPRPQTAQESYKQWKQEGLPYEEEISPRLQQWYNKDKGASLQREFIALLQGIHTNG